MTTLLHTERLEAVHAAVRASGAATILDLGCGDGALLRALMHEPQVRRIVGLDHSADALQRLGRSLSTAPAEIRAKVELICGSMIDPHEALAGFDAAILVETIEHLAPDRLSLLERAVFRRLRPLTVIVTTPNSEFNALLGVPHHRFRHPDHRFEWGRAQFRGWARSVARRTGYGVTFADTGGYHPAYGGATQMGVFQRHADGNTIERR